MFTVYSKDNCKYCRAVEELLKMKDLPYTKYNLGEDFTADQFIAQFGEGSTFPQVSCEGKKLGGSIETIQFLKEKRVIAS